jgi:hypothetical protein
MQKLKICEDKCNRTVTTLIMLRRCALAPYSVPGVPPEAITILNPISRLQLLHYFLALHGKALANSQLRN